MSTGRIKTAEAVRSYWNWEIVLYKGDDIIDSGTIKEIAERRKVLKSSIYFYTTKSHIKRSKKDNYKIAIIVGRNSNGC